MVIAGVVAAMVTASMGSVRGDGVVTASAATAKVKIDKKAFPDPDSKFRLYVKYYFDTNSDGYLSKKERNNAALISAKYWKISSFKGIKYSPNLKYLDCGHNNLTSLDLSGNKKLEKLNCDYNKLTAKGGIIDADKGVKIIKK